MQHMQWYRNDVERLWIVWQDEVSQLQRKRPLFRMQRHWKKRIKELITHYNGTIVSFVGLKEK